MKEIENDIIEKKTNVENFDRISFNEFVNLLTAQDKTTCETVVASFNKDINHDKEIKMV